MRRADPAKVPRENAIDRRSPVVWGANWALTPLPWTPRYLVQCKSVAHRDPRVNSST